MTSSGVLTAAVATATATARSTATTPAAAARTATVGHTHFRNPREAFAGVRILSPEASAVYHPRALPTTDVFALAERAGERGGNASDEVPGACQILRERLGSLSGWLSQVHTSPSDNLIAQSNDALGDIEGAPNSAPPHRGTQSWAARLLGTATGCWRPVLECMRSAYEWVRRMCRPSSDAHDETDDLANGVIPPQARRASNVLSKAFASAWHSAQSCTSSSCTRHVRAIEPVA
jgi:hypothetical protein